MIPENMLPMANDLYKIALSMGASPTNAAYLVGSAYQESSFNPHELDDYVNGQPTSFGLMQVGSSKLGSGSVADQFRNYISRFQSNAPDTWAAMNAAKSPEAAYAAQHDNPDWRMGIPGNRFAYARQVMGGPGIGTSAADIIGGIGGPSGLGVASTATSAPSYPVAMAASAIGGPMQSSWQDYMNAMQKPTAGDIAGSAIGDIFQSLGKGLAGASNQKVPTKTGPSRAQQLLQMLAMNPDYGI